MTIIQCSNITKKCRAHWPANSHQAEYYYLVKFSGEKIPPHTNIPPVPFDCWVILGYIKEFILL